MPKNLLIFSYNPLVGTVNRFGRSYEARRVRGMRCKRAFKTIVRKRLKVIYSIIRGLRSSGSSLQPRTVAYKIGKGACPAGGPCQGAPRLGLRKGLGSGYGGIFPLRARPLRVPVACVNGVKTGIRT